MMRYHLYTNSVLDIQLLGDFVLVSDGSAVSGFSSARLRSLLAYLLLHRQAPQPRSAVAFSLWPDSSEEQAHASLRSLFHLLRNLLPDADTFLRIDSRMVQWRPGSPFTLDIAKFEAALARGEERRQADDYSLYIASLKEAVDLYKGGLLPACYDEWILPERERLHQEMIRALERLVAVLESRNDYEGAIHYAQQLLQHDPLHETTYRLLMRLYVSVGDPARALRVYHTCVTVLQRELGVEPGPSTRQAYDGIRNAEFGTRSKLAEDVPHIEFRIPNSVVGRQREWEELRALWQEAIGGKPQLAVVEGEAGIGKTMLAEKLADTVARQGYKSAIARCYESEGDLAYAPVVTWLRAWPMPRLEPVWRNEVARLVPEAQEGDNTQRQAPGTQQVSEPWQRQRLFEALARAILGSGVSLLVLDDAQWCDADTIEWLHFLLRFSPQANLLVVATLRPEQMADNHPLSRVISDLSRQGKVSKITLGPLNESETVSLAAQLAGKPQQTLPPELSTRLFGETEGNPLFVVEMVRAGTLEWWQSADAVRQATSSLPPTLQAMIEARLSHLSNEALDTARLAATIGRAFVFPVLAKAGDLPESEVVRALDELWQRRIVREYGADAYDFSHDKLREVAYAGLSPARRTRLHRKVAEALEWAHENELDSVSGEIGTHFEKAGPIERAIPFFERAGDAARAVYANEAAIGYYEKVVSHLPVVDRIAILLKLGAIEQLVGKWPDARASYLRAADEAQAAGDMVKLAEAEAALGGLSRQEADYPQAIEWLEKAHTRFARLGDTHGEGEALGLLGEVYWTQSNYPQALDSFRRCLEIAQSQGDRRSIARASGRMGNIYADMDDYTRAVDCFERQLNLATEANDKVETTVAHWNAGNVHWYMADYRQAIVELAQALQMATEIGYRRLANMSVAGTGSIYYDCGDYSSARACYTTYLDGSLSLGNRIGVAIALGNLAATHLTQGDYAAAEQFCLKSIQLARALAAPFYLHAFLCDAAELYERQARYAEALPFIEEAMSLTPGLQSRKLEYKTLLAAISIRAAAGTTGRDVALEELREMLAVYASDDQQAGIHYTIWKIDPANLESKGIAARLYKSLYEATPAARFKERYVELTGEQLLDAQVLPDLPEAVSRQMPDMQLLLAKVDDLLTELSH